MKIKYTTPPISKKIGKWFLWSICGECAEPTDTNGVCTLLGTNDVCELLGYNAFGSSGHGYDTFEDAERDRLRLIEKLKEDINIEHYNKKINPTYSIEKLESNLYVAERLVSYYTEIFIPCKQKDKVIEFVEKNNLDTLELYAEEFTKLGEKVMIIETGSFEDHLGEQDKIENVFKTYMEPNSVDADEFIKGFVGGINSALFQEEILLVRDLDFIKVAVPERLNEYDLEERRFLEIKKIANKLGLIVIIINK